MEHWAKMGEASNLEVENFKTCQVTLLAQVHLAQVTQ